MAVGTGRVAERPLGSPTCAVKSPMMRTTVWPARWNSANFSSTTVWPRWMSAVVGSIPSFTRNGLPLSSCSARRPSGSTSTAFRVRSGTAAMLDCRLRSAGFEDLEPFSWCGAPHSMAVLGLKRRSKDGGEIPPPPSPPISATAPGPPAPPKKTKPRLKKLRVLFVLLGLGVLAVVSMIFGMMAAVSQDLPAIYNFPQFKPSKSSELLDDSGEVIGTLTSDQNKILPNSSQSSPNI